MFKVHMLCILIVVSCLACEKKQSAPKLPPQPDSKAQKDTPSESPKTKDTSDKKTEIKMATKRKRPKTKKEVLKAFYGHLQAGQKAVRAKKYDDGIAEYQKALKLDPKSPTALGEMGWAYFKKKDLEKAETYTLKALAVATKGNQLGMFLYNMGRIAEARGNKPRALRYYRRSARKRDNKVVDGRVEALEASGVSEEIVNCPFKRHPKPRAEVAKLCKVSSDNASGECTSPHKFKGTWKVVGPKTKVLLTTGAEDFFYHHYVVVQHQGQTYYGMIGQGSTGVEAIEEWAVTDVSFEQIVPGGLPEMVVYSQTNIAERDELDPEADARIYSWSEREVKRITVVSFDGPEPIFALWSDEGVTDIASDGKKISLTKDGKTTQHALKDLNRCPDTV